LEALGEVLNRAMRRLPSLAQLKQQLQSPPPAAAGSSRCLLPGPPQRQVEGTGAVSTAAAFQLREQLAGKTVVGVLSGGNLGLRELARTLAGAGD
jgi:hypothetical protein